MPYVTDPIGDMLTRLRNAQSARATRCRIPASKLKRQILELMKTEGWIAEVATEGEGIHTELVVSFHTDKPRLQLTRVSKPGRRHYAGVEDLKPVLRGYGMAVLTTSQGIMTDTQAREKHLGGEVLCTIS